MNKVIMLLMIQFFQQRRQESLQELFKGGFAGPRNRLWVRTEHIVFYTVTRISGRYAPLILAPAAESPSLEPCTFDYLII